MSQDIPAVVGFLCDKVIVVGKTTKATSCVTCHVGICADLQVRVISDVRARGNMAEC